MKETQRHTPATWWIPRTEGEQLAGIYKRCFTDHSPQYGDQSMYVIEPAATRTGKRQPWEYSGRLTTPGRTVLVDRMSDVTEGETVLIQYDGTAGRTHLYRVWVVEGSADADKLGLDLGRAPEPPEEQAGGRSPLAGEDDDLPF